MSKKTKILSVALAAALVIGISVAGTLAYLHMETDPVTNVFTEGRIVEDDPLGGKKFLLKEHKAEQQSNGTYLLDEKIEIPTDEVQGNDYIVAPGINLPKDPFVRVTVVENMTAYLFIEVIDNLPKNGDPDKRIAWDVDEANWAPLMDDGGEQVKKGGHPIWVYNGGQPFSRPKDNDGNLKINIIEGKTINVPGGFDVAELNENTKLEFKAYICQAEPFASETGPEKPKGACGAWNACFAGA